MHLHRAPILRFGVLFVTAFGAAAPSACSHRGPVPEVASIGRAERTLARAEAGPAADAGGVHLGLARRHLADARRAASSRRPEDADAHAYAAERAAQAAEATAGLALAQQEAERASVALESRRGLQVTPGTDEQNASPVALHTVAGALAKHAPELPTGDADAGGLFVTLPEPRAFARGSSVLLPPAKAHLREVAVANKASGEPMMLVLGRVPGSLTSPKAARLAHARTQAIMAWLLACGVPAAKLTPVHAEGSDAPSVRAQAVEAYADLAEVHMVMAPVAPLTLKAAAPTEGQQGPGRLPTTHTP